MFSEKKMFSGHIFLEKSFPENGVGVSLLGGGVIRAQGQKRNSHVGINAKMVENTHVLISSIAMLALVT